jgi:hypothetical protein
MDNYALWNLARNANKTYFRNRSAGILLDLGRDGTFIGSATCIAIGDRLFLATAAHNFEGAATADRFTVFSAHRPSTSPLAIIQYNYEHGLQDGEHDIAWLEIDSESARNSDLLGVALESIDVVPALVNPGNYVATGFPSELKKATETNTGQVDFVVPLLAYITNAITGDSSRVGDIVFNYGQTAINQMGQENEMAKPHGMSGGGMWYSSPVTQDTVIWSPERMKLIGITRDYVRNRDELRGVPIRHWFQLLYNDLPDIRASIEPLLEHENDVS